MIVAIQFFVLEFLNLVSSYFECLSALQFESFWRCRHSSLAYTITSDNRKADARTSLCHCGNCKRFTGGPFGITTKIPSSLFQYTKGAGREGAYTRGSDAKGDGDSNSGDQGTVHGAGAKVLKIHEADNGSGTLLRREFCGECGSGIMEYGTNAGDNIHMFYGTLEDEGKKAPAPKREFFTKYMDGWMPEVLGKIKFHFGAM